MRSLARRGLVVVEHKPDARGGHARVLARSLTAAERRRGRKVSEPLKERGPKTGRTNAARDPNLDLLSLVMNVAKQRSILTGWTLRDLHDLNLDPDQAAELFDDLITLGLQADRTQSS